MSILPMGWEKRNQGGGGGIWGAAQGAAKGAASGGSGIWGAATSAADSFENARAMPDGGIQRGLVAGGVGGGSGAPEVLPSVAKKKSGLSGIWDSFFGGNDDEVSSAGDMWSGLF